MKKFGALLCIIVVAVTLSACAAFHDDQTKNYSQVSPYSATVLLQFKGEETDASATAAWQNWQAALERQITATAEATGPHITAWEVSSSTADTYAVTITIANPPDLVVQKTVRPFKIIYTQTAFNPLGLLPASDTFDYLVGLVSPRRHSRANADLVAVQDDGNYAYFWTTDQTMELVDVYPNRPLYYLLVLVGGLAVGAAVYAWRQYNDCKNDKKPL